MCQDLSKSIKCYGKWQNENPLKTEAHNLREQRQWWRGQRPANQDYLLFGKNGNVNNRNNDDSIEEKDNIYGHADKDIEDDDKVDYDYGPADCRNDYIKN